MTHREIIPFIVITFIFMLVLPVWAHVPVIASGNGSIGGAVPVENPQKTYVFYGSLDDARDIDYFQLKMGVGDQLAVSLMNTGPADPIPDLIILSPGQPFQPAGIPAKLIPPEGYGVEIIRGQKQHSTKYEPFTPAAIFPVAYYARQITEPGTYYVAIVSPGGTAAYSLATGYREEFSPSDWVLVPVNVIRIHLWEGQTLLSVLAPFLAIITLGFILIMRRETKSGGAEHPAGFWFLTAAGVCYLGGAAITLVQMFHAAGITGFVPGIIVTLVFPGIAIFMGVAALRIARTPAPWSLKPRISSAIIGGLGLIFWAGLLIGPAFALLAALISNVRTSSPLT